VPIVFGRPANEIAACGSVDDFRNWLGVIGSISVGHQPPSVDSKHVNFDPRLSKG
jgi:hypothetical protein